MASSGAEAREARSAKRAARETKTEDTDERTALLYNTLDMLESQGFLREQIATAAMDVERETQPHDSHAEVVATEQGNFTMVIDVLFRSEAEEPGLGSSTWCSGATGPRMRGRAPSKTRTRPTPWYGSRR